MTSVVASVSQGGRIVIPADIRHEMGIEAGDQVLLDWSGETCELRIFTRKQRLQHARDLVKKYTHGQQQESVVDELIEERRQASIDE